MMLTDRFSTALDHARQAHATQLRKGSGIPYLAHVLAVAAIALEHGADEDTAIAALLHDVAEDQGGEAALAEIRARFGDRVARFVAECSDTFETPKPPWQARKEAYLAGLRGASPEALLISQADKLHNVRSIVADLRQQGEAVWNKFAGGKEGTLWYYRTLVDVYAQAGETPLLAELRRAVKKMHQLCGAAELVAR